MLHQIKTPQFYTDLGLQKTVLKLLANGKLQGLFKAFECFSSTFQGKFYFQGLFKTVLHIQVLFKPVQTLFYPTLTLVILSILRQYLIAHLNVISPYPILTLCV